MRDAVQERTGQAFPEHNELFQVVSVIFYREGEPTCRHTVNIRGGAVVWVDGDCIDVARHGDNLSAVTLMKEEVQVEFNGLTRGGNKRLVLLVKM